MISTDTQAQAELADTAARTVLSGLESAWNAGDGAAFGEPFTDDAVFVDIRGARHYGGRAAIAAGHQAIFDSIYRGSTVRYVLDSLQPLAAGLWPSTATPSSSAPPDRWPAPAAAASPRCSRSATATVASPDVPQHARPGLTTSVDSGARVDGVRALPCRPFRRDGRAACHRGPNINQTATRIARRWIHPHSSLVSAASPM